MESQSHRRSASLIFLTFCLAACSTDDSTQLDPSLGTDESSNDASSMADSSAGNSSTARVEWKDVAPIFAQRCVGCHQSEGIAPFSLTSYDTARTWAVPAAAAVQARVMPPWLMTDDGSCNSFDNSRWLSQEEIDTIAAWAEQGAPEGSSQPELSLPPVNHLDDTNSLFTPEYVPAAGGGELARFDDYRCFPIGEPLADSTYLTGYEILPGNDALVHHVLVMPVDPDRVVDQAGTTNADVMAALDAESPDRDGWPCFGAAGDGVWVDSIPVTWAPGMGPVEYPEEVGVDLPAGTVLVAQIHYNMSQPGTLGQSDRTEVRLRYAEQVERPGFFDLPDRFLDGVFEGNPDTLPAGRSEVPYTWERSFDDYFEFLGTDSLQLYGLFPHMHELGRSQTISRVRADGQVDCLGNVQRWDFNWQLFYFYQQPIEIQRGDSLRVTCNYDTSSRSEPTLPGWGTQNEMCLSGILLVP